MAKQQQEITKNLPAIATLVKMDIESIEKMTNAQQLKPVALGAVKAVKDLQRVVREREGEIAALGDTALFVRRDAGGKGMHAYRAEVTLQEGKKELATIAKSPMITAAGAIRANQVANLQVLTPATVIVDGTEQPNPFIEREPKTRAIQSVYIRRVAFGPSPTGNLVAVDCTLYFNVYTYFLQDLQAKLKRHPDSGILGVRDQKPDKITYKERKWDDKKKRYVDTNKEHTVELKNKTLAFFPIEEPVGLWVDLSHTEIQSAFNEHVSRQKFGDRHARSIVTRNVLLEHPAIGTKSVIVRNGQAILPVYGWNHPYDMKEINRMADKIAKGDVEDQNLEVITKQEEAAHEDLAAAADETGDEFGDVIDTEGQEIGGGEDLPDDETTEEEAGQDEEPEGEAGDSERSDLMGQILEGIAIIGKEEADKILKKDFDGKKVEELETDQLQALDRKVSEAVDMLNA